jgi:hypothetical protein
VLTHHNSTDVLYLTSIMIPVVVHAENSPQTDNIHVKTWHDGRCSLAAMWDVSSAN